MSFLINDFNINPNRNWYVKITDAGTEISVKLFLIQSDAASDINLIAQGTAVFGTGIKCVLSSATAASVQLSLFNTALQYHLKVSGQNGDTAKIYHIAPFVDLPDINNSIYRSQSLIEQKAIALINEHTHTASIRTIMVANHNPAMKTCDIIRIQSVKTGLNNLAVLSEIVISGTPDALTNQIETREYQDIYHG